MFCVIVCTDVLLIVRIDGVQHLPSLFCRCFFLFFFFPHTVQVIVDIFYNVHVLVTLFMMLMFKLSPKFMSFMLITFMTNEQFVKFMEFHNVII